MGCFDGLAPEPCNDMLSISIMISSTFIISGSILVGKAEWFMSLSQCLHTTSLFSALVDPLEKLSILPPMNDSAAKSSIIIFTCFFFESTKPFTLLMVSWRPSTVIFNACNVIHHLARWPCNCNVYESTILGRKWVNWPLEMPLYQDSTTTCSRTQVPEPLKWQGTDRGRLQ